MFLKLTAKQKKTYGGGVFVFILLLATGLLLWPWLSKDTDVQTPAISSDDVRAGAVEFLESQDVDGGLAHYDRQISQLQTDSDRRDVLVNKSDFARQFERHDEALEAAKQAQVIEDGIPANLALARVYEEMGDRQQALIFYRKVYDALLAEDSESRYVVVYEEKIKWLEQ